MKTCILCLILLTLVPGCAIHLSTYDLKVGMVSATTISVVRDGRVEHEDVLGIHLQWLPKFTWLDIRSWFWSND